MTTNYDSNMQYFHRKNSESYLQKDSQIFLSIFFKATWGEKHLFVLCLPTTITVHHKGSQGRNSKGKCEEVSWDNQGYTEKKYNKIKSGEEEKGGGREDEGTQVGNMPWGRYLCNIYEIPGFNCNIGSKIHYGH